MNPLNKFGREKAVWKGLERRREEWERGRVNAHAGGSHK